MFIALGLFVAPSQALAGWNFSIGLGIGGMGFNQPYYGGYPQQQYYNNTNYYNTNYNMMNPLYSQAPYLPQVQNQFPSYYYQTPITMTDYVYPSYNQSSYHSPMNSSYYYPSYGMYGNNYAGRSCFQPPCFY
jgi:hypothetical protein